MNDMEKLLMEEKHKIDQKQTPPELEDRLRAALFKKENARKKYKFPPIWKTVAAILLLSMLVTYNYQALAYYGKKIIGFDDVVSGTLQQLNEAGMGQVVDESVELQDGVTFKVNGVMTDENRMVLYYTITSNKGNIDQPELSYNPLKITGFFTNSRFEGGGGMVNQDNTAIKGTYSFEPPSPFAKELTLHFNGTYKKIQFNYDPSKAMGSSIKQAINKDVLVDGGVIDFQSITASPTLTVIKGSTNVKEIGQVLQPFAEVSLIANGETVEQSGRGYSSSSKGYTFELKFDALPHDLKSLQLKVNEFIGYDELNKKVPLKEGEEIDLFGKKLTIKGVSVGSEKAEVTVVTDESVLLDEVSVGNEDGQIPLKQSSNHKLEKLSTNMVEERTLIFNSTKQAKHLYIGGIYHMKSYQKVVNIPVN